MIYSARERDKGKECVSELLITEQAQVRLKVCGSASRSSLVVIVVVAALQIGE